ncbi:hypothetical protein MKW92_018212 [Papaver armeniacum]|nr:hypothetical protein MKW92_018212 [Papaver armeniacum]
MVLELIGGYLVGPTVKKLLEAFVAAIEDIQNFEANFRRLRFRVEIMLQEIEEMRRLYPKLGHQFDELNKELEKGKNLIQRCEEFQSWNFCLKLIRGPGTKEMKELGTYLIDFLNVVVQVGTFIGVGQINEKLGLGTNQKEIIRQIASLPTPGEGLPAAAANPSDDQSPFKDDVSLSKYCAPNGIGKTTLPEEFHIKVLLQASFETLWHDCSKHRIFGKSYLYYTAEKNMVIKASTLRTVVKKNVSRNKEEFEKHMAIVGNIRHPNVAPVRAYYFSDSNENRAIVYDYYDKDSVYYMLHGKDSRPLRWDAILKIAIDVAIGITCIHRQDDGTLVHGNIKSPNIFLNDQNDYCISDLGQNILFPPVLPFDREAHKHLAPEMITDADFRLKPTQASDIYSYGTLLVELLYGKLDLSLLNSDGSSSSGINNVILREQFHRIEKQWEGMKKIAMSCTSEAPDERPKINGVVTLVEEVIKNAGPSC